MAIRTITYFINNKKKKIKVKICNNFFSKAIGLMFRRNSFPLLFIFNKEKKFSIHSIFCKPFTAVWLDDKMHTTQVLKINNWRTNIVGKGKYLLEIPRTTTQ